MTFWIAVYTHRHGNTVWPIFQNDAPNLESLLESDAEFKADWEGAERDDEFLDIEGPFQCPCSEEKKNDKDS